MPRSIHVTMPRSIYVTTLRSFNVTILRSFHVTTLRSTYVTTLRSIYVTVRRRNHVTTRRINYERIYHEILKTRCADLLTLPPSCSPSPSPTFLHPITCFFPFPTHPTYLFLTYTYETYRLTDLTRLECSWSPLVNIPKVSTTFHQWALRLFPYIETLPIILLLSDIHTILCNHKANTIKTFFLQNNQGFVQFRRKRMSRIAHRKGSAVRGEAENYWANLNHTFKAVRQTWR